tara:strand:- start:1063 stop:1296 length:234 start_codon:yes stop_codon:yes gene_type:complete
MLVMEVVEFMNGSAEVNQLELCVDRLMRTIEQLTEDNKALRRQVHNVIKERDAVSTQKQRAVLQLKQLIQKVKESSL